MFFLFSEKRRLGAIFCAECGERHAQLSLVLLNEAEHARSRLQLLATTLLATRILPVTLQLVVQLQGDGEDSAIRRET